MTMVSYLALAAVAFASDARDHLLLTEKPGHATEGIVVVDASPSEVYALVTDYASWPSIFRDVSSVEQLGGGRREASVRFTSRAIGRTVTVKFDNVADRLIRFHGTKGPPGGVSSGSYQLTPIDNGTRTLVHARLYMNVTGVPGMFISDAKIRSMRQTKLRSDMNDVIRRFPSHQTSPQAPRP
jgi:hypothetical protein